MVKKDQIHATKTPRRPHFIQEWAELRGYKRPVDLANALRIEKSTVSRWYEGSSPNLESQEGLAELFFSDPEERDRLFRHPDDDWMTRFFRGREQDEIDRIKRSLEITFPRKSARNS